MITDSVEWAEKRNLHHQRRSTWHGDRDVEQWHRLGPAMGGWHQARLVDAGSYQSAPSTCNIYYIIIFLKKLQTIHLMLYKRWCKTPKINKYKHEVMY